jgi:hypothetical protein
MKPDPLFHRVRYMTPDEEKEQKRKYTRKGKKRRAYRGKRKNIVIYEGGDTGLRQQRRK